MASLRGKYHLYCNRINNLCVREASECLCPTHTNQRDQRGILVQARQLTYLGEEAFHGDARPRFLLGGILLRKVLYHRFDFVIGHVMGWTGHERFAHETVPLRSGTPQFRLRPSERPRRGIVGGRRRCHDGVGVRGASVARRFPTERKQGQCSVTVL